MNFVKNHKNYIYFISFLLIIFLIPKISHANMGCLDYGMAYEDYSGYCKCMAGYVWGKNF
jgi:hypothetical protein